MSRQLIAGKAAERGPRQPRLMTMAPAEARTVHVPGVTTYPSAAQAIAAIREMVEEVGALDRERREIERRLTRLRYRLADPGLFDHPKRGEAERRYEEIVAADGERKWRMESLMLVIGDVYLALSEDERVPLAFPPVTSRYGMRTWMESCLAVGLLPGCEIPF